MVSNSLLCPGVAVCDQHRGRSHASSGAGKPPTEIRQWASVTEMFQGGRVSSYLASGHLWPVSLSSEGRSHCTVYLKIALNAFVM